MIFNLNFFVCLSFFYNFYYSKIDLQCCVSFKCTATWISYTCTCTLSFLDSLLLQAITEDRVEFPVLHSSAQLSRSVVADSVRPREPQHARPPVHHQLPESTQTHVHRVGDAIQPSHPLSSPSPPAPNPSQHQSLFKWVSSSHQMAKVLELQLPHQPFQWTPWTGLL